MLRHTTLCADVRQVDFCRSCRRQLYLSLLSSFLQALHSHWILCKVDTLISLEALNEPIDDYLVEVITTKVSITISRKDLKYTATELKNRDIESTTTKVEYGNLHILVSLVYTISKSCSCWLVNDTLYIKTCNLTSLLSSLTL